MFDNGENPVETRNVLENNIVKCILDHLKSGLPHLVLKRNKIK